MDLLDPISQCSLQRESQTLIIDAPNSEIAGVLWKDRLSIRKSLSLFTEIALIQIKMLGQPLLPAFSMEDSTTELSTVAVAIPDGFERTTDFILQTQQPCCVTDHLTHKCLLLNDRFEPGRLIWRPTQLIGFNFLDLWRDSMDDLERLLQELRQNGKVDNFRYRLRRVDGSLGYYVQDYRLIDFLGSPARVSVSHEWGIIEPTPHHY